MAEFPIRGLDVSHHQGPIDWPLVAEGGDYRFVWVKATEGGDWVDPRFAENWRGAQAAGLDVGAYHYFTLCRPGDAQADHFLATLATVPNGRLPPAVDLEHEGNCKSGRPGDDVLRQGIKTFLDRVERATGRPVVVYTTREFYRTRLVGLLADEPVWLRDVFLRPPDLEGRPWAVWQYASRGRVPGIPTFADLNAFRGDAAAYARFLALPSGGAEPAAAP